MTRPSSVSSAQHRAIPCGLRCPGGCRGPGECGSSRGQCGRRRARAADTCGRRSCAEGCGRRGVRSNSAPQASSSRTQSGASLACSSAMRQLLRYWPPRMVSAKWTFQLSRSSTLARAAAIPPSAITVCALPSSDLQMTPTDTPMDDASMAARRSRAAGADHQHVIRVRLVFGHSENSPVGPDAHGAEPDVDIGEHHGGEAHPGPEHVAAVEATGAIVGSSGRLAIPRAGRGARPPGGAANGSRRCSRRAGRHWSPAPGCRGRCRTRRARSEDRRTRGLSRRRRTGRRG